MKSRRMHRYRARRGSLYRSGRTRSWLKTKCFDEGVVIGPAKGEQAPVALLALESKRLVSN